MFDRRGVIINKKENDVIKFNNNISLNKFEKLIFDSFNSLDNHKIDPRFYFESILDLSIKTTNMLEIFQKNGLSKDIFLYDIKSILRDIFNDNSEDEVLNKFIFYLNKYFNEWKSIEMENKNIIAYTNIPHKFKNNDTFLNTLKFFNLEIFNFSDYVFDENTEEYIINKFSTPFLMLKYQNKTRHYEYFRNKALISFYSFFGYITFVHKFNKSTEKIHINNFSLNHSISDLKINSLIFTNESYEVWNIQYQYEIMESAVKLFKSKIVKFNNNISVDPIFFKILIDSNNTYLLDKIKEYFYLYYLASSENMIESSFIKFWSMSEKIIKEIGNQKYKLKEIVSIMSKVLTYYNVSDYVIQRLEFIKNKRNKLVHENEYEDISQLDQSIVKIISERLLCFLIEYSGKVSNLKDYIDYLENIG